MEKKVQFTIKGTHCQACKKLIERKFIAIAGVVSANVDFETGAAEIILTRDISNDEFQKVLDGMEYKVIWKTVKTQSNLMSTACTAKAVKCL